MSGKHVVGLVEMTAKVIPIIISSQIIDVKPDINSLLVVDIKTVTSEAEFSDQCVLSKGKYLCVTFGLLPLFLVKIVVEKQAIFGQNIFN